MTPSAALVVIGSATEGGELLAARLRALLEAGWDARLLCSGWRWAEEPALRDPALQPHIELTPGRERYLPPRRLLVRPAGMARYVGSKGEAGPLDQRLLELRPDLIHFHSGWAAWKAMRLKRLLGCRVVVSFREGGQDLAVRHPELLWEADLLLFPDAATLRRAVIFGCPEERASVLEAPPARFRPDLDGHRPEAGKLRVVSAGPMIWEQGFEHSLHGLRLLLDMGVACDYRILGEGDHFVAVAFARHQLGLADHVHFVTPGRQRLSRSDQVEPSPRDGGDHLAEELRAADAFVDPAVADTTSLTGLASAQAHAIPFVATRREDLPEDGGIVVPRRSPGAIAEALARLARDPALRVRMGEAGRRRARPTLEDHGARLEALYRRALAAAH